ncbi:hypothetical protein B0J18DRAFT_416242 [Chaetomium sp. MPI-SDFR-AT-0129]|nr:hypothetical protein B0J18DRAFT_416242 [Chaetomium sp. MPI-SDFR-AT-0129]
MTAINNTTTIQVDNTNRPNTTILLQDTPTPSPALLARLTSHLPYSLPLLRRLQFADKFKGGRTDETHVLYARLGRHPGVDGSASGDDHDGNGDGVETGHFAAAYVDLSQGPETQVWVYSSLEPDAAGGDRDSSDELYSWAKPGSEGGEGRVRSALEEEALDLVLALFRRIRTIAAGGAGGSSPANATSAPSPAPVLAGTVHEVLRHGLLARGVRLLKPSGIIAERDWEVCGKWLFRVEDIPTVAKDNHGLPEGMRWDRVRPSDIDVARSRTNIKRRVETMLKLPGMVVRLENEAPAAWAFLGLDGSLMVHVEEAYRQLGLARLLVSKLMVEHIADFSDDGWGTADVFTGNYQSQGLCRKIGGKNTWALSWALVDVTTVGDAV